MHLRRVLVEGTWQYRHHPFPAYLLEWRQPEARAAVLERAWSQLRMDVLGPALRLEVWTLELSMLSRWPSA